MFLLGLQGFRFILVPISGNDIETGGFAPGVQFHGDRTLFWITTFLVKEDASFYFYIYSI